MVATVDQILLDTGSSGPEGWHGREVVLRCARKHGLAAKYGAQIREGDAQIRGSLVHVALAHYYAQLQARQQGWDPDEFFPPEEAVHECARRHEGAWPKWVTVALAYYTAYKAHFALTREEVIAVEHIFAVQVPGPATGRMIPYKARVDLVLCNNGRVVFVDHKTTGRITEKTEKGFALAGQLVGQQWIGRHLYAERWGGLNLNLISPDLVRRIPAPLAGAAVAGFPKTLEASVLLEELWTQHYGPDPTCWPLALSEQGPCVDRYDVCAFHDVCRFGLLQDPQPG